jgi:hypothetical protein
VSNPLLAWLGQESVALLAMTGAAITVLAVLGKIMPIAPQLAPWLAGWNDLMHELWRPPLDLIGAEVHPQIVAALNVATFMALIGAGARFSAWLSGRPLAPLTWRRFFDDQSGPSLAVFAALCLAFLVGQDVDFNANQLVVFGSEKVGQYAFAGVVTAGYFAGDFIGHREFHLRLYRLAALVVALIAANVAMLQIV